MGRAEKAYHLLVRDHSTAKKKSYRVIYHEQPTLRSIIFHAKTGPVLTKILVLLEGDILVVSCIQYQPRWDSYINTSSMDELDFIEPTKYRGPGSKDREQENRLLIYRIIFTSRNRCLRTSGA